MVEKGRRHTDLEIPGGFHGNLKRQTIFHCIKRVFALQFYKGTETKEILKRFPEYIKHAGFTGTGL